MNFFLSRMGTDDALESGGRTATLDPVENAESRNRRRRHIHFPSVSPFRHAGRERTCWRYGRGRGPAPPHPHPTPPRLPGQGVLRTPPFVPIHRSHPSSSRTRGTTKVVVGRQWYHLFFGPSFLRYSRFPESTVGLSCQRVGPGGKVCVS